jgi:hypothetical protein
MTHSDKVADLKLVYVHALKHPHHPTAFVREDLCMNTTSAENSRIQWVNIMVRIHTMLTLPELIRVSSGPEVAGVKLFASLVKPLDSFPDVEPQEITISSSSQDAAFAELKEIPLLIIITSRGRR